MLSMSKTTKIPATTVKAEVRDSESAELLGSIKSELVNQTSLLEEIAKSLADLVKQGK